LLEWDQRRLSNAVLDHVTAELGSVGRSVVSRGSKTASDVRAVATNMRLLFNHFEEVQLAPVLEQSMRECPLEVLNFAPQEKHLRSIQDLMASQGLSVPLERLREVFSAPYEGKVRALSEIQRIGILGFINRGLGILNQLANDLEQQSSRTMKVRSVRVLQDDPLHDALQILCGGLELIDSLLWIGCALIDGPFCVAAALLAALIAILHLIGLC